MLRKNHQVVLKSQDGFIYADNQFKSNTFYRCIQLSKGKRSEFMVYGCIFSAKDFKEKFEYAIDRIKRDFVELGLLKSNLSIISKNLFSTSADVHQYGSKRSSSLHVWYFRISRDMIYGFYPSQGSRAKQLAECYQMYLETLEGNMDYIDCGDICFGNCGIPISYGKLRVV